MTDITIHLDAPALIESQDVCAAIRSIAGIDPEDHRAEIVGTIHVDEEGSVTLVASFRGKGVEYSRAFDFLELNISRAELAAALACMDCMEDAL
jgi:hypothetical protein